MRTIFAAVAALTLSAFAGAQSRSHQGHEEFTATALSAGGPLSDPVAGRLEIAITRWSTDAERQRLLDAVKRGQNAALDVLQDLPEVGYIRTPTSLRWALRYAHQRPGEDGGRRIVLATDRPLSFAETVEQPRTTLYPFTLIELRVNDEGDGTGTLSRAVRIIASRDGKYIQLENYEGQPVNLTDVRHRD